jgi:regulator of protease activity HflC (stomatin/prohibitin superfamily)
MSDGEFKINLRVVFLAVVIICLLGALLLAPQLYDNVLGGSYHITQSPFSGHITARMTPGPYAQLFSDIKVFPVSETFFFTQDEEGGVDAKDSKVDASIEVQFSDGSKCKISGTCRVDLPSDPQQAIELVTKYGYTSQDNLENRLIVQVVRNGLIATANQMTAKESYSDKRLNFISDARDQIIHGIWKTKDLITKEIDPATKQEVTVIRKIPITDDKGIVIREPNPLDGTGVKISQFVIKDFNYEEKVRNQIQDQQKATMAVQTAKAMLLKAEQDKLTVEAEGKAKVMSAQYEEEQKKIRAEVEAQKEREVATIQAQKAVDVATKEKEQALVVANRNKEVAALELDAAKLEKQRQIELGTGEAERKKLVMQADGALEKKLEAWSSAQQVWAAAFKDRKVPSIVMAGSEGGNGVDGDASVFMKMIGLRAAQELSVNMGMMGENAQAQPAPAPTKK